MLLLLCFSAVFLPLDFLHNHGPLSPGTSSETVNSNSKEKLSNKTKADYCWVCAVHFDKTFTKASIYENIRLSPIMSVFLNNKVTSYVVEQLLSTLRGPPTE